MKKRFILTSVLAAIAISACHTAAPVNPSKIVVFGDSLSDVGYQNNLPNTYEGWPKITNSALPKQPTFTSPIKGNTVWPQYLVSDYNPSVKIDTNNINTVPSNKQISVTATLDGNDYAAGGATTVCNGISLSQGRKTLYTPPPIGPLRSGESCPSAQQPSDIEKYNQIDSYLSNNNGKANPGSIYILFGGANNAFLGHNMQSAAKDIVSDADYLVSKGARPSNIYIINLPTLGITPLAIETSITSEMNYLSTTFNNELNELLKSRNYHLIDVDKNFFDIIVKNKKITISNKTYPFSNVSDGLCKTGKRQYPNALVCIPDLSKQGANTYLFEGNVHPTSYTHEVLAKYIKTVIDKTHS